MNIVYNPVSELQTTSNSLRCKATKAAASLAVTIGLATASTSAMALDFYFDVVNNTDQAIVQAWVAPASSGTWGAPFKNVFVPHSGGRQRMEFAYDNTFATTCSYDVKVKFAHGQMRHWNALDLCSLQGISVDVVFGEVIALTF